MGVVHAMILNEFWKEFKRPAGIILESFLTSETFEISLVRNGRKVKS